MARNTHARAAWWTGALALSVAPGCYTGLSGSDEAADGDPSVGSADDGPDDDGPDDDDDDDGPDDDGDAACRTAGSAPARLLTRAQYDATVQDLLHTDLAPAADFLPDNTIGA